MPNRRNSASGIKERSKNGKKHGLIRVQNSAMRLALSVDNVEDTAAPAQGTIADLNSKTKPRIYNVAIAEHLIGSPAAMPKRNRPPNRHPSS